MERFEDQPLGPQPRIAVLSSSKVGNFVVSTPLLRGLKEKYPESVVDFFGSEVTRDFEEGCPWIDKRFSLHGQGSDWLSAFAAHVGAGAGPQGGVDLAINCDGFSELNRVATALLRPRYVVGATLDATLEGSFPVGERSEHRMLADDDWNGPGFVTRYAPAISSNYIGEIFCRMAFVDTEFTRLEVPERAPSFDVPDLLLHVTTTRRAKMWPISGWIQVLEWAGERGLTSGLIGTAPDVQRRVYNAGGDEERLLQDPRLLDLRGRTPLIELAGALARAKALVTVDAGPMHVAAAVGCPTLAIFGNDDQGYGASPVRLWAPRSAHVKVLGTPARCEVCVEHRFKNGDCLVAGHPCMSELQAGRVIDALAEILDGSAGTP